MKLFFNNYIAVICDTEEEAFILIGRDDLRLASLEIKKGITIEEHEHELCVDGKYSSDLI